MKVLIRKINASIWFQWMKKRTSSLIEDKRQSAEGTHSSEPQKAYHTGEFVIVAYNGGHVLLRLASRLATVVSQAARQSV